MAERSKKSPAHQASDTKGQSLDALASKALSLVAQKNSKNDAPFNLEIATQLRDVAADATKNEVPELIAEMLDAGISADTIATVYIPHAARQMGDDWCDDTLSFARVTIGTARLQSSLRALGTAWSSHGYSDELSPEGGVIIIVAKDAFHTLGAMVLCGQLRRMGLSVRLAMGVSLQELRNIFLSTQFDAALISASEAESLDSLRECVNIIRTSSAVAPPIIIGGNILDQDADVKGMTGADFTTKDPFEALEHCGISRKANAKSPQQERRS